MTVSARASGRCLCGAVRNELRGALRDVVLCYRVEYRRWSGHVLATTAVRREGLVLLESGGLRWIEGGDSDSRARSGFCRECGSSLFWDAPERNMISVAAGGLDRPTRLRLLAHVHVCQAGDRYDLREDGLGRHQPLGST